MWEPPQCGEWTIESFEQRALQFSDLEFGIWDLFGIWNLEFGISAGLPAVVPGPCQLSAVCGQWSVVCGLWSVVLP